MADSIEFVNPTHWDAVAACSSFFLQRHYLRVVEQAKPDNFCSRYAMIYRDGEPLGAVVTQIVKVTGDRVLGNKPPKQANLLQRALAPAPQKVSASMRERILICGNLFSWGCHGLAVAPGVSPAELWAPVAEAIYRIRRSERLSGQTNLVLVKDIPESAMTDITHLKRFSYRPVTTDPDMVLTLSQEWQTYDDYVNSLDRNYKKSALQIAKEIEAAGCTVETLSDLNSVAPQLHELYLQVHQNASVRPVTLSPTYQPALAQAAGKNFRCIVIRRGDTIPGFVSVLRDRDTAIGYYIGYDRAAAAEFPLYLRLLHAIVGQAITWKCRRLSLGRTALEPKARLGAKPEAMSIWVRYRHPA